MALNYEYERAIRATDEKNNIPARRLLRRLQRRFQKAEAEGIVQDLPREEYTPPKDWSDMEVTESSTPYNIAPDKDSLVFTSEIAGIIANFLGLQLHWESQHAFPFHGKDWYLSNNKFSLTLRREETGEGEPTGGYILFHSRHLDPGHPGSDINMMEGITRIMIQPTVHVATGSILFFHESENVSIVYGINRDGRGNFHTYVSKQAAK